MINGVTFDLRTVSAKNDGQLMEKIFKGDGVIKGCGVSFTNNTITVNTGYFIACGRNLEIMGAETIGLAPTLQTGYARLRFRIDTSASASTTEFTQGSWVVDYSATTTFPELAKQGINDNGNIYEIEFAVFQISGGNVISITRTPPIAQVNADLLGGLAPSIFARQADMDTSLRFVRELGAGDNLNNLTAPGIYFQPQGANWSGNNYPPVTAYACLVLVANRASSGLNACLTQIVIKRTGEIYIRAYHTSNPTGGWSDWTTDPAKQSDMDKAVYYRGLLGTQSLNGIFTNGIYYQNASSNTSTDRGYPELRAGTLVVAGQNTANGYAITQTYTTATQNAATIPTAYVRSYCGPDYGGWSAWTVKAASQADMDMSMAFRGDLGTSNLNNVVQNGMYRQTNSSNATTARNYPEANVAGALLVFSNGSTNSAEGRTQQIFINGTVMYFRNYVSASWGAWRNVGLYMGETGLAANAYVNANGNVYASTKPTMTKEGGTFTGAIVVQGNLTATGAYSGTTGNSANVHVDSSGRFLRSTSSEEVKANIQAIEGSGEEKAVHDLKEITPITFQSRCRDDDPDKVLVGFSADRIATVNPKLATLDEDGKPIGYDINALIATLWKGWQINNKRLDESEEREGRLLALLREKGLLDDKELKALI